MDPRFEELAQEILNGTSYMFKESPAEILDSLIASIRSACNTFFLRSKQDFLHKHIERTHQNDSNTPSEHIYSGGVWGAVSCGKDDTETRTTQLQFYPDSRTYTF